MGGKTEEGGRGMGGWRGLQRPSCRRKGKAGSSRFRREKEMGSLGRGAAAVGGGVGSMWDPALPPPDLCPPPEQ